MEYYHWIMLAVASGAFALCLRRDPPAALGIFVSQVPFWLGVAAWLPAKTLWIELNMLMSLAAACAFLVLAHVFGGVAFVAVCLIFVAATVLDIVASLIGVTYYLELHEIFHYLAIIGMASRTYVDRVFNTFRAGMFDGDGR